MSFVGRPFVFIFPEHLTNAISLLLIIKSQSHLTRIKIFLCHQLMIGVGLFGIIISAQYIKILIYFFVCLNWWINNKHVNQHSWIKLQLILVHM